MRKPFSLLIPLALAGIAWCTLFSCSTLQGEMAPPVAGGTMVVDGAIQANSGIPQTDWRLLAFFSPT